MHKCVTSQACPSQRKKAKAKNPLPLSKNIHLLHHKRLFIQKKLKELSPSSLHPYLLHYLPLPPQPPSRIKPKR